MIELLVTSAGLAIRNVELLWINATHPTNGVTVVIGEVLAADENPPDLWRLFARSHCNEWDPQETGCLESRIVLTVDDGVVLDLVAWSEARDRTTPIRDQYELAWSWIFEPTDVNLDGLTNCDDLARFSAVVYDWNHDGAIDDGDVSSFLHRLTTIRGDFNGDGVLNAIDFELLESNWGLCPSPPAQCPFDLDCNGAVGMNDVLLLLLATIDDS